MPLSAEQRSQFGLHFLLLDHDADGRLAVAQLGPLLRAVGLYPTAQEVTALTSLIDPNGTGSFSKESALATYETLLPQKLTAEELHEALKVLDEDEDGYMTSAQLRHVLVHLGVTLTAAEADEVIADVGKDADEQISLDDLVTLLLTERPLRA